MTFKTASKTTLRTPTISRKSVSVLRRADGELTSIGRIARRTGLGRLAYHAIFRPRRWWRRRRLPDHAVAASLFGYTIQMPTPRRNMFSESIVQKGIWEPEVTAAISRELTPGMCVVDVGADIGYYVLLAASLNGKAPVLAFEPNSTHREYLERNVSENKLANVRIFAAALGNSSGRLLLQSEDLRLTNSAEGVRGEWVNVLRFDDPCAPWSIHPRLQVDFIIIDVEGAEHEVLSGMMETLQRDRPKVFVELHGPLLPFFGSTKKDVLDWMSGIGYTAAWIAGDPLGEDGFSHAMFRPAAEKVADQ